MRIRIRGGNVLAGKDLAPTPDGVVEIEGTRIVAIGRAGDFPASNDGVEIIDATGCTVLPGLIDTHVHIFIETGLRKLDDGAAALWASQYIRQALRRGVTTVRDLGAQTDAVFALRRGVNEGWIEGPRILTCGRAITMTGGHGWMNISTEADGADGVRQAARRQLRAGADVIKVMASGGGGTPGELATSPQFTVAELRAAVEEAHDASKPVAAHALATRGIMNSLLAGADTIEHGVYLDDACVELMLKNGTTLCPTISVYPRVVERGLAGGASDFFIAKSKTFLEPHLDSLRKAVGAGVKIVFGTDSARVYNGLGDVSDETRLMVEAGMTPHAVIVSATRTAAEICGIGEQVGTLEAGKTADLILVKGDPTQDIGKLGAVQAVFRDGKRFQG
ncbi:amidohydrolase family protein [Devosia sp. 2618]|uniref:metal-dependent hydrolase family protein n=1 Tax=Devosia sp. 2618 TaxID=3156454 RepID=UPI0033950A1B